MPAEGEPLALLAFMRRILISADDFGLSEAVNEGIERAHRDGMLQLTQAFGKLGRSFIPSVGNFVAVHVGDAAAVNARLLRQGVIVRPIANYGMPQHLRITLNQGIKRQIRLMLYELGYEVERLVRTRIGPLKIGGMRPGEWRLLEAKEVKALKGTGEPK